MPTTINKQKVITHILNLAKGTKAEPPPRPVLEMFLYAVCREGVGKERADRAFKNLQERFFDWNEIRVSSARELAEALEGLPQAELRGQRLIDFLQEVFETTYSFDLDLLAKKGLKQAAKQLSRYKAASDFAISWVVQHSLGGHAIPLDPPALRVLRRLGLLEEDTNDLETLRSSIEHLVPKAKGHQFVEAISHLAEECCLPEPNSAACPLSSDCQACQVSHRPSVTARPKPR